MTIGPEDARRLYRADLEAQLEATGGKSRKRTYRAMLRALAEHRGAELDAPDEEVLVWSDLHLGHENIIDYQGRPFADRADMDAELWERWESVLEPDSVLVLVGDVAIGPALCDATWARVKRSPGRHKHLVIGNHDLTGLGELRAGGFDDVWSIMTSRGWSPRISTGREGAWFERDGVARKRGPCPPRDALRIDRQIDVNFGAATGLIVPKG